MRRRSVMLTVSLVAGFLLLPTVPAQATGGGPATPVYYPSGPQTNVDESVPLAGGWSVCYSDTHADTESLATVLDNCDGEYLLMASGPPASTTFDVLAAAPRADVLFDTDTSNTPHDANGTGWYFDDSWSWGFAAQGDAIYRNTCDYGDSPTFTGPWDADRLCWHTSSGNLGSGWRSGSTYDLDSSNYRRVIMEASPAAVAVNDFYELPYRGAAKLDVLSNDEGGPTAITGLVDVVGGSASVVNVGGIDKVYFEAAKGFVGLASFKYRISDGQGGTDAAMVRIEVFPQYDTKVTLNGPDGAVKAGSTVKLTGKVKVLQPVQVTRAAQRSAAQSGLAVNLQKRTDDGWKKVASTSANDNFEFSFKVEAKSTTKYRAELPGDNSLRRSVSDPVVVEVAKPADPKVEISVNDKRVRRYQEVVVSAWCGKDCAGKRVELQKKVAGNWYHFAHTRMNDNGRHNFRWETVTLGTYNMRVVVGDRWAVSRTVSFEVV